MVVFTIPAAAIMTMRCWELACNISVAIVMLYETDGLLV